jgi:ribosomal protein S18 acetylase RimI-like enzyme
VNHLNVAEIDSLFVEAAVQHRGVGTRLVRRMIRKLRALHPQSLTVNVAIGNESTFAFYRRFGFLPRVTSLVFKRRS